MIASVLPRAHTLTRWSSPPVTITPDVFLPIFKQFTFTETPWATNSSDTTTALSVKEVKFTSDLKKKKKNH
jgi:hypothetical protein